MPLIRPPPPPCPHRAETRCAAGSTTVKIVKDFLQKLLLGSNSQGFDWALPEVEPADDGFVIRGQGFLLSQAGHGRVAASGR